MRNSKTIINKILTMMMTDQPCADQFFYAKKVEQQGVVPLIV